jgi:hypothetical protein
MRETAPRHKKEVTMGVAVVVIIAVVALGHRGQHRHRDHRPGGAGG